MKCPECGKNHRKQNTALKCRVEASLGYAHLNIVCSTNIPDYENKKVKAKDRYDKFDEYFNNLKR
jgi:hypothetical protein